MEKKMESAILGFRVPFLRFKVISCGSCKDYIGSRVKLP